MKFSEIHSFKMQKNIYIAYFIDIFQKWRNDTNEHFDVFCLL